MNKSTVIFAALALFAASCTKTEVVSCDAQGSQRGIGFSAYTAKPTKAAQTDVTTTNLTSFQVSAIGNNAVYFDNVTFTKNDAGVWASTPLYFWPSYELDFYAYNTPANRNFTPTINTTSQTLSFKPSTILAEQEDLVAACAEDQTDPRGSTSLTFNHYLTQIVVKAKSSNTNYTVKVSGVKIANLKDSLTFTFSDGSTAVSVGAKNQDYSSEYETAKTLNGEAQEVMVTTGSGKWYLVPQTVTAWDQANDQTNTNELTYLALKVKITDPTNAAVYPTSGESAWMAVPVPASQVFEPGHKYTFVINFFQKNGAGFVDPEKPSDIDGDGDADSDKGKPIIGGAITFNADVTPWPNETVITIDL